MKRMSRDSRAMLARRTFDGLAREWLCTIGAWNRDKVLEELERLLRNHRRNK